MQGKGACDGKIVAPIACPFVVHMEEFLVVCDLCLDLQSHRLTVCHNRFQDIGLIEGRRVRYFSYLMGDACQWIHIHVSVLSKHQARGTVNRIVEDSGGTSIWRHSIIEPGEWWKGTSMKGIGPREIVRTPGDGRILRNWWLTVFD